MSHRVVKVFHYICIGLCLSIMAFAQNSIAESGIWPSFRQEGKIFQIKITPMSKSLVVEVVGYPAADVAWSDLSLDVTYGLGKNKKSLQVKKRNGSFEISKAPVKGLQLKIRSQDEKYKENFDLNLK